MNSDSNNLYNQYLKMITEAARQPNNPKKGQKQTPAQTPNSPSTIKKQANVVKGQAQSLSRQAASGPNLTAGEIVKKAQPLIAGANKEAKSSAAAADVTKELTRVQDIPRMGESELQAWTQKSGMETEWPVMSVEVIEEHVEASYMLKQSFLLIGDPGQGKSSIMRKVAQRICSEKEGRRWAEYFDMSEDERVDATENPENYFIFVDLRLADMERTEIMGTPEKSGKGYTTYSPPHWAKILTRPGADGFIFLDEFNQGDDYVKKAAFKIVLDRVLGDRRMAEDVGVVAACNMGEIFGNEPISPANINRFGGGVMVVSPDEWRDYAIREGIEEVIIAFTKAMPEDALYKEPNGENPFVTPRQLEMISKGIRYFREKYDKAIAEGKVYDAIKHIEIFAAGKAGVPWATKFMTFLKYIQSFDIKKILQDPKKHLVNKPLDQNLALVVYVTNLLNMAAKKSRAANGTVTPEDREIMLGVAVIMTHMSVEAVTIMFNFLLRDLDKKDLGFLLDYLTYEKYDQKVKDNFLKEVIPVIKKVLNVPQSK